MIVALGAAAICLILCMALAFLVQRVTGNSGWIDTIWTFSVGVAGVIGLVLLAADANRRLFIGALLVAWSARLGLHILARTRRTPDDPRYAKLIADWGPDAPWRLFLFLQIQAGAGWVLVLCIVLAAAAGQPVLSAGTVFFALLAAAAIVGEGVADAQLAHCKKNRPPQGICDQCLWGYSRHPNYFFEWLFWAAMAGMALAPPDHVFAFAAVLAPAMMYWLLRYASGVPHLEAHMQRTRPEAFREYAQRVPVFFPRFWR